MVLGKKKTTSRIPQLLLEQLVGQRLNCTIPSTMGIGEELFEFSAVIDPKFCGRGICGWSVVAPFRLRRMSSLLVRSKAAAQGRGEPANKPVVMVVAVAATELIAILRWTMCLF